MHNYPAFFDEIPKIALYDPLAGFLGACKNGIIEYCYWDAVKTTGHSCPTVGSAYWLTRQALLTIYDNEIPGRGGVRVEFSKNETTGTTGVVANVVSMITRSSGSSGFKGIGGVFDRTNLMSFGVTGEFGIRYTRRDSAKCVEAEVKLDRVPNHPEIPRLMRLCLSGEAIEEEQQLFCDLWQERVRKIIIDHANDKDVFVLKVKRT